MSEYNKDYVNGYNQALEDVKYKEILEMLIDAVNENKNNQLLSEGWFNAVEKLIKETT